MKILVIGLGNEIIADDAVGILAARELKGRLGEKAEVVECSASGIALLDFFIGFERAIIIDSIISPEHSPGEIVVLHKSDFRDVAAPSPHYSGLPEIFTLAKEMDLEFPDEVLIYAVTVSDPYTIGGEI